ncbi:MAG: sugar kinase [Chloroflexi bacterium]|nr:sugar kinase [Chloroflexota bacterium]
MVAMTAGAPAGASAVIALGEALVEVMRPGAGQPLDQPGTFVGPLASGAPAIFAVAAARLGLAAGFAGAVGDDAFARLLQARFEQEGVDARGLQTIPGQSTAVAFVAYDERGGREFVFHLRHAAAGAMQAEALDPAFFAGVRWLHLSGSTLALNEGSREAARRALALTQAQGGKLSLDPNLRPELLPVDEARALLAPFLAAATLVVPTAAEARALTGATDDEVAARSLLAMGAQVVALKQGSAGATFYTQDETVAAPGFVVEEVDPTGAGDCFNAACVYGLEQRWPLAQVARFATAAGALAVTRQGPMEGAPTAAEVQALIQQNGEQRR